jgi:hypothetical protein
VKAAARCALALLGAWLALATFAPLARADTTIGFDDLSPGTVVTNQYAGQGASFSGSLGAPVVKHAASGVAQSPPNVADIHTVCDVDRPVGGDLTARFANPHAHVSVYAGDQSGNAYPGNNVTLTGYDSTGTAITSYTSGMLQGGVHNLLSISDPAKRIASVDVAQAPTQSGACAAAVDDFSFGDTAGGPPPPDFALTVLCPPACPNLSLQAGSSLNVTVQVTRNQQSSGPIALDASGLPPGVSASFDPNPIAGGGTSEVTLTLTADPSAPTASNVPVTITGTPQSGSAGTAARSTILGVTVAPGYDLRLQGIEVNQGVQLSNSVTSNVPFNPMSALGDLPGQSGAGQASYRYVGVPLVASRRTIVTVYGTVSGLTGASSLRGVTAALTVSRNGTTLGTLSPENLNDTVPEAIDGVFLATRISGAGAFVFSLPPAWASGTITLTAQLTPPPPALGGGGIGECGGCQANNTMTLNGVAFTPVDNPSLDIVGIDSWDPPCTDPRPPSDDQATFAHAVDITPVNLSILSGFGTIDGCAGSLEEADPLDAPVFPFGATARQLGLSQSQAYAAVRAAVESNLNDQLEEMTEDTAHFPESFFVGLTSYDPGVTRNEASPRTRTDGSVAVENWTRPLTSVAHETGHLLFRPHASACNGGAAGGAAESWPPDQMGLIQGVGVDRLDGDTVIASGAGATGQSCATANPIGAQCTGGPSAIYDYMSYCASTKSSYPSIEPNTWISPQGWQEIVSGWATGPAGGAADLQGSTLRRGALPPDAVPYGPGIDAYAATSRPALAVTAIAVGGRAMIVAIRPSTGHAVRAASAAAVGLMLVARDVRGRIVASAPMSAVNTHGDPGPGKPEVAFLTLSSRLPASAAIASIELRLGRQVLDRIRRPAHPPRVRLLAPRRGRVGRRGVVVIRWRPALSLRRSLDPRRRLTASIDYSLDGGRRYRTIYIGPSTGRVALPSSLFAASRNARIRIRVSDGFSERAATSGRLVASGSRPRATIIDAPRLARVASDASISLRGVAQDDQEQPLPATALSWYLGNRRLGNGQELDAIQLPPGRDLITLVARDAQGRVGRATMRLDVVAVAPSISALQAPVEVSPAAHRIALRIATRARAALTIGAQRWQVGPTIRAIEIKIARGAAPLRLHLTLMTPASNKTTTLALQIARAATETAPP